MPRFTAPALIVTVFSPAFIGCLLMSCLPAPRPEPSASSHGIMLPPERAVAVEPLGVEVEAYGGDFGVEVEHVRPGSPADAAGIKAGALLTASVPSDGRRVTLFRKAWLIDHAIVEALRDEKHPGRLRIVGSDSVEPIVRKEWEVELAEGLQSVEFHYKEEPPDQPAFVSQGDAGQHKGEALSHTFKRVEEETSIDRVTFLFDGSKVVLRVKRRIDVEVDRDNR